MEHTEHHDEGMTMIGKIIMLISVFGGFWLVWTLQHAGIIPIPLWATNLVLVSSSILIGGSSTLVPEEHGGRASTYVAFVMGAIGILMLVFGTFIHAGGV